MRESSAVPEMVCFSRSLVFTQVCTTVKHEQLLISVYFIHRIKYQTDVNHTSSSKKS